MDPCSLPLAYPTGHENAMLRHKMPGLTTAPWDRLSPRVPWHGRSPGLGGDRPRCTGGAV